VSCSAMPPARLGEQAMHFGIACGGTGGHVFPGLATAQVLQQRGHGVTLWLTGRDVEQAILRDWTGHTIAVGAVGFSAGLSFKHLAVALRLVNAVRQCRVRMRCDRPDLILAMGSYASVGPALAARSLGVPLVLHEANALPGRAVTFLSRFSQAVGLSFPSTGEHLRAAHTALTGFPVRADLQSASPQRLLASEGFSVLVMGGSQGSHCLNTLLPAALALVRARGVPVQAIHVSGQADAECVREAYERGGVPHRVFDFLPAIGDAYAQADLAVARAGAATCAELAVCGVPALLVPLPAARRDHQTANARALEESGGADVMLEADLTEDGLVNYLLRRSSDTVGLDTMRAALAAVAVADGADRLADLVETCAEERCGVAG